MTSKTAAKKLRTLAVKRPDNIMRSLAQKDATPPTAEQATSVMEGTQKGYAAVDPVLNAIDRLGSNNLRRLRGGTSTGAKPLLRRVMGTPIIVALNELVTYPTFTVEELCILTGKSEVNVRTALTDLRSPKYCGVGGPFVTVLVHEFGLTSYQYDAKRTAKANAGPA